MHNKRKKLLKELKDRKKFDGNVIDGIDKAYMESLMVLGLIFAIKNRRKTKNKEE